MLGGLSGISSARYDMHGRGPLRRAYIIAASYRSGSTHLCTRLWHTGVLGAPFEYLNYEHEMRFMYSRLGASSPADYLRRLIQHRMSDNGVFGLKAHFHHFRAALRTFPDLLQRLAPVQFIFIRRNDKLAQAVSLAKALQSRAWLSLSTVPAQGIPLFYSREFISACLAEVLRQETSWTQWFEAQGLTAHNVHYEDLLHDERQVVGDICRLLGVQGDAPSRSEVPVLSRQSDCVNTQWADRYREGRNTQTSL